MLINLSLLGATVTSDLRSHSTPRRKRKHVIIPNESFHPNLNQNYLTLIRPRHARPTRKGQAEVSGRVLVHRSLGLPSKPLLGSLVIASCGPIRGGCKLASPDSPCRHEFGHAESCRVIQNFAQLDESTFSSAVQGILHSGVDLAPAGNVVSTGSFLDI